MGVDGRGNVWVAGTFGENYWGTPGVPHTVTFGTSTLTSVNQAEIFLVKLNPTGNVLWARQTQSPQQSDCSSLAVDAAGNAYLTGRTDQTAQFGALTPSASNSQRPAFMARYDAQGTVRWVRAIGGWGIANRVATDATGACYLLGTSDISFTLGTTSIVAPANTVAGYLAKLDAQGSVQWAHQLPSVSFDANNPLAVAPTGTIRLAIQIYQPTSFGGQTFTPVGRDDVLCLGFTPQGFYQWGVQLGGATTNITNSDSPSAVAVGADGTSYFAVNLTAMSTITQPSNLSDTRQFLVSFAPTGALRWSRIVPQYCYVQSLAVLASDELRLAGAAYLPLTLDGYKLTCQGAADGFTARLANSRVFMVPPPAPELAAFIPNLITPNGDGQNDTFRMLDLPDGPWQLHIYSRLGRLVYQTDDYHQDWNAPGLPDGLYYYYLQSPTQPAASKGWVEVIH
jgi:gliding motility-associated-like protein